MSFFMFSPELFVEVGIQDANLGDPRDGQLVTGRGATDRFRGGSVVDAEASLAIGRDVRMDPRDAVLGVVVYDHTAEIRAGLVLPDGKTVRKISLDQVAGHASDLPWWQGNSCRKHALAPEMQSNR